MGVLSDEVMADLLSSHANIAKGKMLVAQVHG